MGCTLLLGALTICTQHSVEGSSRCLSRQLSGKEPACQCRRHKSHGFDPWLGKIPWRRKWQLTPVFLPGESHGQWSLVGYSHRVSEVDMTEAN